MTHAFAPALAVVCSGLLLVGCAGRPEASASPAPGTTPSPTSATASYGGAPTPSRTTAQNVRATRALSQQLLQAIPLPPGARVQHRSPVAELRAPWVSIGPSDPALSRHLWWTVPMGGAALGRWLCSHMPHGMRTQGPVESVTSIGRTGRELTFGGVSTSAHTAPYLDLVFVPDGVGQAVRLTTFVGARFPRTASVPAAATVLIRRTTTPSGESRRPRRTVSRRVATPAAVRRLVALVNALPGSMTVPFVTSCPAAFALHTLRMTFAGPGGRYVLGGRTGSCWPQLTLRHDGTPVGPTLDPDRRFLDAVDRVLRQGSPGVTASAR